MRKTIKRLFSYVGRQKGLLFLIIFLAIISNVLAMYAPRLIGDAIDFAAGPGRVNFHKIYYYVALLAAIYAVSGVTGWLVSALTNKITYHTVARIRSDAFAKLGALPLKYYDTTPHGDIISRLTSDIDFIGDGLFQTLTQLFSGVVVVVSVIIFMLRLDAGIALVVLIMTPVSLLFSSFVVKHTTRRFRQQSEAIGELNAHVEEILSAQKTARAFEYEDAAQEKFEEINARLYDCGQKAQFYSSLVNPGTRYVNNLAYILVGAISGAAAIFSGLSVGCIASFLNYATQFARPINDITSVTTQLQAALASAGRVFELLDEPAAAPEPAGMPVLANVRGEVRFDNVCFSYDGRPFIENFSFTAPPGAKIAIVGPTGCGKTTLVNLLMGFYEPQSGRILVDGTDISTVTKHSLRRSFAMVLQDTWLFSGTISENVAYGKMDAGAQEIAACCKKASAHSFIRRLENGYNTEVGEDGGGLSGGQKQLLTIARAMLASSPMLILDEATSSVDTWTEQRIQQGFLAIMQGKTSFVIAHRLSTIKDADIILVMNAGKLVEQGTHQSLLSKGGFYARLYNSQFKNGIAENKA